LTAIKAFYARKLGLPEGQIRFFDELDEAQVAEVRQEFSAGLVSVDRYVYAVKRDGHLVSRRERRDILVENQMKVIDE
jgi:hypothetical protein